MPSLGTFNLHASLLPNYRGAAPINWAIINGETKTGVTTFFIDDKIDTGAMILNAETAVGANESAGELHDRLALLESGRVTTTIQKDNAEIKTAYKLNKENCKIDWNKTALDIHNLIRGLSPYPAAWCFISDKGEEWNVKIYQSSIITESHSLAIGQLVSTKKELKIAVANGFIQIESLQFPGKKKMNTAEFLNGIQFTADAKAY
jgi:methionyl-tRNA formyltransferase